MLKLGVNIDHVATLRQARYRGLDAGEPDPVAAALAAEDAGAHGITAHQVQNTGECANDPQLAHRGHFRWRPQPFARQALVDFPPYTLSRSPGGYAWAGPTYGQHVHEVLHDLLGYDDDRIAELAIAEALE